METLKRNWMVVLLVSLLFTLSRARLVRKDSILKTIKNEDGDVIDCIDIYKQPAFDHPLLANHTLQMKPSWYLDSIKGNDSSETMENCPEGTIPIARNQPVYPPKRKFSSENQFESTSPYIIDRAKVSIDGGIYYGASGTFNLWNPKVMSNEYSHSQVWVEAGKFSTLNVIEAGWMLNSVYILDRKKIFGWQIDNFRQKGCYNLDCPGFIQTNHRFSLGGRVPTLQASVYGGSQYSANFKIHKDTKSGSWWLFIQDIAIGYWPVEIFTNDGLTRAATRISWGGEVLGLKSNGVHTRTEMGSGHFANELWTKAAFIKELGYFDQNGIIQDADKIYPTVTRPNCYSLSVMKKNKVAGVHFYFGGPGYSDQCKSW
ncbi:hypothetical protein LINGRAPRIM_LOCUS3022 [Linum grandiflorum]